MQKKRYIFVAAFLVLMLITSVFYYKYQNKSFLKQSDIKNEVFTEDFFEGLIQVQSTVDSYNMSNHEQLKKLCIILAELSLKESNYESKMNHYGGYFYRLNYEHGKEKQLSFLGISEEKTLIYVDDVCYETDEKVIPQIVKLFQQSSDAR